MLSSIPTTTSSHSFKLARPDLRCLRDLCERGEVSFSADILAYYAENAEAFLAPAKLAMTMLIDTASFQSAACSMEPLRNRKKYQEIVRDSGSLDDFEKSFTDAATSQFLSGW